MQSNFDLSVINENDINKLNTYIDKCVKKLYSYISTLCNAHLNEYPDSSGNSEVRSVINNNFENLFRYLDEGYKLVSDRDLYLKWYFLEQFWFLINGESYLSSFEKNNIRNEIEYIEYKLNLLIKKYNGNSVSRFIWL